LIGLLLLLRVAVPDGRRVWSVFAIAVHMLRGTASLVLWGSFVHFSLVPVGIAATVAHACSSRRTRLCSSLLVRGRRDDSSRRLFFVTIDATRVQFQVCATDFYAFRNDHPDCYLGNGAAFSIDSATTTGPTPAAWAKAGQDTDRSRSKIMTVLPCTTVAWRVACTAMASRSTRAANCVGALGRPMPALRSGW
jgi:hypothetical protein